jgi:peptidoglycan hydrolase-like protein with peptidoglycan-binding domain
MNSMMQRFVPSTLVIALTLSSMSSIYAFPNAFFHTLSEGNRGTDVKALQFILNIGADGVFGSGTKSAVVSFQSHKGLIPDGIVGPATWGKLIVTLRRNNNNNAVKALQTILNAKRNAGLTVDGDFGAATETAVKNFQSHAGITPDGVVGPTTWKNLIWHFEYADFSANLCDQDPDGNGLANWGVASTVAQLEEASRRFSIYGKGKVPVGDISHEHGGDIIGHASHELGVDVDVWPIRTDNQQCSAGRITWQSSTYDRTATRRLIQAIRDSAPHHVALIFFNDPVLISEGLTTHYPNHDNHLHVRYK